MPHLTMLLAFAAIAVGLAVTPGPNMAYLVSRSIAQGRRAGLISLVGVGAGSLIYMLLAAFGITALLLAVPFAYDALRLAGAAYLAFMAWNALRPGGNSPFHLWTLPRDAPLRLFGMGLLTNLLNPKIAALYLSLLPQFIDRSAGNVLAQTVVLGLVQIAISMTCNTTFILTAGAISAFLTRRPIWASVQRWLMGTVLGLLAIRLATDGSR
jgi:threonine/homoserine/homoserine lactone efflux protein